MKRCSKCKETKPRAQFSRDKSARDEKVSSCKVCVAAYAKAYNNRPHIKEKAAIKNRSQDRKIRQREYNSIHYSVESNKAKRKKINF